MSLPHRVDRRVLALFVAILAGTNASAETYRDAARHFSLELPAGWQAMSAEEFVQLNNVVRQRMPGSTVVYIGGFRRQGSPPGSYPYILVQHQPVNTAGATYADIERALGQDLKGQIKEVEGAFADLTRNASVGSISLDRSRNRILTRLQMDVTGIGTVQGLTVGHIGSEGLLFLHGYDRDKDFPLTLPALNQINEAFRYDAGFTFTPSTSSTGSTGSTFWSRVGRFALVGGIIGVLVGGLLGLVSFLLLKNKSSPAKKRTARRKRRDVEPI